jgi:hypothetical protein
MILNYRILSENAAINVFPISDSNTFSRWMNWKERRAYYFTGLDYRMLVCPFTFAADELLLERPGLYMKTNLPLGGIVYFPKMPDNYNHNDFLDNLAWIVDSYMFKFNATRGYSQRVSTPRLYVDYAKSIPNHGPVIFDNARVMATPTIKQVIDVLSYKYSAELTNLIMTKPEHIQITNYAETSLLEEVCSHNTFVEESEAYLKAVACDDPQMLKSNKLTNDFEKISCSKRYNRSVLSFYLAARKEPFPNSPGSYIGMFKNLYNVLEYLMVGDGQAELRTVLNDQIGLPRLGGILSQIKTSVQPQSTVFHNLTNGERLSPNRLLPPLSENDSDLAEKIAERLYIKRNACLHSKKIFRATPVEYHIRPGPREAVQLETDLALMWPIAEAIVEELGPNE